MQEEPGDAASLYQAEVTESRKSIKKMINIHVGGVCVCACVQVGPVEHSPSLHTRLIIHIFRYIMGAVNSGVQTVVAGVRGGGDQEVNMIQPSSFISLMKVIKAYRERKAVRLTKTSNQGWLLEHASLLLIYNSLNAAKKGILTDVGFREGCIQ